MKALLALVLASLPASAGARTWDFDVFLDERPVGFHRFTLRENATSRELTSMARFDVRILGIPVYRYTHDATERWKGDCLTSLHARTDDNGERSAVDIAPAGCTMTFAYWNPRILESTRLWNAQTGALQEVSVAALDTAPITLNGETVAARRYRISGPKHPIELWYSTDGEWLALASTLDAGRRLRYRLKPMETSR